MFLSGLPGNTAPLLAEPRQQQYAKTIGQLIPVQIPVWAGPSPGTMAPSEQASGVMVVPVDAAAPRGQNDSIPMGLLRAPNAAPDRAPLRPLPDNPPRDRAVSLPPPTGFLRAAALAWNRGVRSGHANVDGLVVDMGGGAAHEGWYDTNLDGTCDSFFRRVGGGKYWSVISPNTPASQYTEATESAPRGRMCSAFGIRAPE